MNWSIKELDLVFKAQQEMTKTSVVIEEIQNFNKSCIVTTMAAWNQALKLKMERKMENVKDAMSSNIGNGNKTNNFLEKGNL